MIAHLSGNLFTKSVDGIIVDVGGVGYEVAVPLSTFYSLPEVGEKLSLLIYTHVKEGILKLFGFHSSTEKKIFIKLISISGVGPKLALSVLSGLSGKDLLQAISGGDESKVQSIPGIGKKTAERIILELKDKVGMETEGAALEVTPGEPGSRLFDDVLSALLNLGYKKGDVEKRLNIIKREDVDRPWSFEPLLKEALRLLAK